MMIELRRSLRRILVCAVVLLAAQNGVAEDTDARSVVVDSNGKIFLANFLCATNPECTQQLQRLSNNVVKQGAAVALGTIDPANPENYVFIANSGRKSKIELFVEEAADTFPWTYYSFDSRDGATAAVVARNGGTLFVARESGAVESFRRGGVGPAGYDTSADFDFHVEFSNGAVCRDVVGLEELSTTGEILAVCNAPGGVVKVTVADDGTNVTIAFADIIDPGSLGVSLSAGGFSRVPVDTSGDGSPDATQDFLLLVSEPSEVLAVNLADPGSVQRNLLIGSGKIRDLATGLCNIRDPGNNNDSDLDVDQNCFTITQSGNSGKVALAELEYDPISDQLMATIVDRIDGVLKNTYGTDLVNTGTVPIQECLSDGCQLANNDVQLNLLGAGVDPNGNGIIAFETQGPFIDARFEPLTGLCDRVELPLEFTNIPILKEASIGPEFCSRGGVFFVDLISAPDVLPDSGYTQYETPGDCWVSGIDPVAATMPTLGLDGVEYGTLFGDQFDLLRVIPAGNTPIQPGETYDNDYVTNRFVQDNLVGCATRVRATGRLTFVIEDLFGNQLSADLGSFDAPIGDNVLYKYGNREANQRIDIPLFSPQSGCYEELSLIDALTGACESHVIALNGGLAGWDMQRLVGEAQVVTSANLDTGIEGLDVTAFELTNLAGLELNVEAEGGTFKFRGNSEPETRVLGLNGRTDGELDVGQSLTFSVSTMPRPADNVLAGDVPVEVTVPFIAGPVTLALFYDGPEFSDVQEAAQITATLTDGVKWTATFVNLYEADHSPDQFSWDVVSDNLARPAPIGVPLFTVLSGDDSGSESAVVRIDHPFGDVAIRSLEIAPITGSPSTACPTCSNQSDFSFLDLGIEGVNRIEALSFAYQSYLRALCSVSTRDDFGTPGSDATRPKLCIDESIATDTDAFNRLAGGMVERNIAGYQQADIEGVLRFIAHNICELDYDTDIDPAGIGFGVGESFCTVTPEWAAPPSP